MSDKPLVSSPLSDEGIAKLIDLLEHGSDALRCGDLDFGDMLMLLEKAITALRGVRDGAPRYCTCSANGIELPSALMKIAG